MGYATDSVSNSLIKKSEREKKYLLIVSYYLSVISLTYKPRGYLDTAKTEQ